MRTLIAIFALALVLSACASNSSEDKSAQRLKGWFSECGYPVDQGLRVTPEEERQLRACVTAHRQAWRARNRSVWVAPMPPFPEPTVQCITVPHGVHTITRCR